jgi:predicted phosphodiesterase
VTIILLLNAAGLDLSEAQPAPAVIFPLETGSVRFAIIGDSGSGDFHQAAVASQMMKARARFPFEFVLMLGDNIHGGYNAENLKQKFETPYKDLLQAGVQFYACLGNHDSERETSWPPLGMKGRYYNFRKGDAEFFALDSNDMDPAQLDWLSRELAASTAPWKICFFHHPLYSDARYHGSSPELRGKLEPILTKYSVDVVFSGHDHIYERIQPQHGIYYFILGNSGELRPHDLAPAPRTIRGFDTGRDFAMFEIAGARMYFETISEDGMIVDSDILEKRAPETGGGDEPNR